jgi:hypothetical protein
VVGSGAGAGVFTGLLAQLRKMGSERVEREDSKKVGRGSFRQKDTRHYGTRKQTTRQPQQKADAPQTAMPINYRRKKRTTGRLEP